MLAPHNYQNIPHSLCINNDVTISWISTLSLLMMKLEESVVALHELRQSGLLRAVVAGSSAIHLQRVVVSSALRLMETLIMLRG